MPHHLVQKTFKMEIEFTVTMDELGEEHLSGDEVCCTLPLLKQLQQALLKHEPALNRHMLAGAISKLQEYADYLAAQSSVYSLKQVAETLEPEEREFFEESDNQFSNLTRPIRLSSITTHLVSSAIQEKVPGLEGGSSLKPVWTDLYPETEFGRRLARIAPPDRSSDLDHTTVPGHYLMVRYLTRQIDGVHCAARCSCDALLEGVGQDEPAALTALWKSHRKHTEFSRLSKMKSGLKKLFSKN
jgi:hypothetical protein